MSFYRAKMHGSRKQPYSLIICLPGASLVPISQGQYNPSLVTASEKKAPLVLVSQHSYLTAPLSFLHTFSQSSMKTFSSQSYSYPLYLEWKIKTSSYVNVCLHVHNVHKVVLVLGSGRDLKESLLWLYIYCFHLEGQPGPVFRVVSIPPQPIPPQSVGWDRAWWRGM